MHPKLLMVRGTEIRIYVITEQLLFLSFGDPPPPFQTKTNENPYKHGHVNVPTIGQGILLYERVTFGRCSVGKYDVLCCLRPETSTIKLL